MALRTCVVCRSVKEKELLARFTARDGAIVTDKKGFTGTGRGAYLCLDDKCFGGAHKRQRAFEAALKVKVVVGGEEKMLDCLRNIRAGKEAK